MPRADWLSFTRAGAPWLDFEWLAQLIFESVRRLGGFFALWLLKGLLLLAAWMLLDSVLRQRRASSSARAAGLVLWSAAALSNADIRPELFSLVGLAAVFWLLESLWAEGISASPRRLLSVLAGFAIWSSLHAAFLLGLALIALYGLEAWGRGRKDAAVGCAKLFAAAALGALLNPYGFGPYEVAWSHWRQGAELSRYIAEWQEMSAKKPAYWGFWIMLACWAAAALPRIGRRGSARPWTPWLASAVLGVAAIRHERAAVLFSSAAVLCVCSVDGEQERHGRRALAAAAAVCAAYVLWLAPRMTRGFFDYRYVPRRAAEFLARERAALEPLRAYNPWAWGGYLGWRLSPWYRVFVDGRYIFHDILPLEAAAADASDPRAWQEFLSRRGMDGMLLENLPKSFPTTRLYPDGSTKGFARPYYLFFAPQETWALVYWDETALLFVRRGAAPKAWIEAHEYRYLRPRDDAAFQDALSRGEIPKPALEAESRRHQSQMRALSGPL